MTSFIQPEYPSQHPGVVRAEQAVATVKGIAARFDGARSAAVLGLAVVLSALLVVANEVIDTWSDGHLLVAWILLWTVAFAALALLAQPARYAMAGLRRRYRAWTAARKQAASDAQMWDLALRDARIMAEISRAMDSAAADKP